MNAIFKVITLGILAIATSLILNQCKSPDTPEEISDTGTDAITETDTSKVKPEGDKNESRKPLTLIVKNLASATSPVVVGVYKSKKNFLKVEGRLKEYIFNPSGTILTAEITDLNYGEYAMAIYQDVNINGKIDKNFIGVPTEGYAFSNNYKPKVKAPGFKDCSFVYDSSTNTVTMSLIQ